jgi:hypothetical protein
MLLALLLDPHFPTTTLLLSLLGIDLAWLGLVGWSIWQLFRRGPTQTKHRGLLGLGVAAVILAVGWRRWALRWRCCCGD